MIQRLFLIPVFFAITVTAADAPRTFRTDAVQHGTVTLAMIQSRFYLPRSQVYAEEIRTGEDSRSAAFAWSSGVQLSALTAAARVDRQRYLPEVRRFAAELDAYWINANGLGGYNASVHPRSPDRYYDDNAWLVLGMVEAYELTHDSADLDRAKAALHFVLSGEDDTLGGGLWWQEAKKRSKNTCSNAPGICAALRVFRITHDQKLFKTAKRLYDWTRANLQDKDGLYFDSIGVDHRIGRMKWSYNTALMIRAACLFYDQTGDAAYLREAERVAAAAQSKWVKPETGAIADPACFAHLLAEAMLELSARDHDPRWRQIDHAAVEFLWNHNRDSDGFYPDKWNESDPPNTGKVKLINQASAARAYFRAAWPN